MPKAKITIRVREILDDIGLGMDDGNLMSKYRLTPALLEKVLDKLVAAGLITEEDLRERSALTDTQVTPPLLKRRRPWMNSIESPATDQHGFRGYFSWVFSDNNGGAPATLRILRFGNGDRMTGTVDWPCAASAATRKTR